MPEPTFNAAMRLYTITYECKHNNIATLRGIFAAEDGINRTAPTYEEMEHELRALLSAKLVVAVESGYKATATGIHLYDRANQLEGNVFERLEVLAGLLEEIFQGLDLSSDTSIDKAVYSKAYTSYYSGT